MNWLREIQDEVFQLKAENAKLRTTLELVHRIIEHDDTDFSCCAPDIAVESAEVGLANLLTLKCGYVKLRAENAGLSKSLAVANTTLLDLERLNAELKRDRDTLHTQRIKYGPICIVCGAAEPCYLKDDPHSPCSFDPAPRELWDQVVTLKARLQESEHAAYDVAGTINQLKTELTSLRDWRATVTVALNREGGIFFDDVPNHIRGLVKDLAQDQAREQRVRSALQMLVDKNEKSWDGLANWAKCWYDAKQAMEEEGT